MVFIYQLDVLGINTLQQNSNEENDSGLQISSDSHAATVKTELESCGWQFESLALINKKY